MNKFKKIINILIFTTLFLTNINFSFAQNNPCGVAGNGTLKYAMTSYEPSANRASTPLFDLQIFNQPCFELTNQNYGASIQFLFDLMIGVTIALAVIMFTYGAAEGILIDLGVKGKLQGKDRMKNAIYGLIIVLSSWLIINTINPDLLRQPIYNDLKKIGENSTKGSPGTQTGITVTPGG